MKRALLAVLLAFASPAHADTGALFGESARAVSLADSVVARPGDTSAIWFNPAGIADLDRPTLTLYGHLGSRFVSFARTDEIGFSRRSLVSGYGLSIVARLPGPEWLSRVRIGGSVHVPGRNIVRTIAPVRSDEPSEPYYGGRIDRTGMTIALAVELLWGLRIGAAVSVFPNLVAPTAVGFDAGRGESVDEGVIINQDRILTLDASALLGLRWQILPELALGLAWRQGGATRAEGTFDIAAGAIVVSDSYRFYDLLAPEEVALGIAVAPFADLSLSLDVSWARWSQYRTIFDEAPEPGFSDVIDVRFGAEWTVHPALRARAGYAFLPSPVPQQTGAHNFLDSHRHEVAVGFGIDLEALANFPLRIDVAFRFHAQHRQSATKDLTMVPDALPDEPGHTIANLGYPGFRSRGSFEQVSLSLTFALDGARAAASESEAEPDDEPAQDTRPSTVPDWVDVEAEPPSEEEEPQSEEQEPQSEEIESEPETPQ